MFLDNYLLLAKSRRRLLFDQKLKKIFTFHSKVFNHNMFLQAVHFVCVRSLRTVDPIVLVFWGAVVSVPPLAVAAYLRGALHLPEWGQIPSIFLVRKKVIFLV